ncbi:conserved hypothetical protein [Verrucomicrobia bacterium]|nr:conserved hypothetical protein [Verrucomicrobiota bacterium]
MPVAFYMDAHVPAALTEQLRLHGVEVLAATEEGTNRLPDDKLLELATELGRVVVTQDVRFRVMAEDWQRLQRPFAGLIFARQRRNQVGLYLPDLELVAKASEPEEWRSVVAGLPL